MTSSTEMPIGFSQNRTQADDQNKLTIIAWGGDLDRIWPTTILATTAAASGMESTVFFTFWGMITLKTTRLKRWKASKQRFLLRLGIQTPIWSQTTHRRHCPGGHD